MAFWLSAALLAGVSSGRPLEATEIGGERPASYMDLGLGGMETALGGAAVALGGDVMSMFHNPAGLTGVRTLQFYSQYAFMGQGRSLGVLAIGNRLEKSPLSYGLSWVYFSGGSNLEYRLGPSLDPISTFSDTEMTFAVGAGYRLSPRWQVGLTGKIYFQSLFSNLGWGGGGDLGLMFRCDPKTTLGLALENIYSRVGFQNALAAPIPPSIRLGAHRTFGSTWAGSAEVEESSDRGFQPKGGVEYTPVSGLSIRAGYGSGTFRAGFAVLAHGSKVAESFEYVVQQDRIQHGLLHQVILEVRFL